jgi:hypothetical protein
MEGAFSMNDYEQVLPGRNIWKKVSRWLFMTVERLIVAAAIFFPTVIIINYAYPYNIGWLGLMFGLLMLILYIYLVLPAPSNPNALVYKELAVALLASLTNSASPTTDVLALTERHALNQAPKETDIWH